MWGALLGAGAAFLGGFFTGGATWSLIPVAIAGGLAGAGAQAGIEKFGSTLFNSAQKAGISPQELLELQKMRENDRKKWLSDNNEDLKALNEKINKLEEQRNQILKKIEQESDPTEKAKLIAAAEELKKEINELRKEKRDKEKDIKEVIDNLPKGNLTPEQFQQEGNKPYLSSFKNWGIIALFVLVGIILVVFIKKLFKKFLGSIFE